MLLVDALDLDAEHGPAHRVAELLGVLRGEEADAAALGGAVVLDESRAHARADLAALVRMQRRARGEQEAERSERRERVVRQRQQAPDQRRYQEEGADAVLLHRVAELLRLVGRRQHEHGRARVQHEEREGAAAAIVERRRREEPVLAVEAEVDPDHAVPREELAVADARPLRPAGGAGGQRHQQRQVTVREIVRLGRRRHRAVPGSRPRQQPLAVRLRPVGFDEDQLRAEVRRNARLLRGRPAPIERQDDDPGARQRREDHQVLDAVPEGDPGDVALREAERTQVRGGAPHQRIELAVRDDPLAVHHRGLVRERARVMRQRFGDVHAAADRACARSPATSRIASRATPR